MSSRFRVPSLEGRKYKKEERPDEAVRRKGILRTLRFHQMTRGQDRRSVGLNGLIP